MSGTNAEYLLMVGIPQGAPRSECEYGTTSDEQVHQSSTCSHSVPALEPWSHG